MPPRAGNVVVLLVGHWTCNSQVVGSSPDRAPSYTGLGRATYTCVPLSPSSITWFTSQRVVMLCSWEGNRTSGVTLAMCHRFSGTVKPLMFACPLFREFRVPNKTAKLKGANINCRPKDRTKLLQYFELYGFNSRK